MKKYNFILLFILSISFTFFCGFDYLVGSQNTLIEKPTNYNVLILGDSIAAGYVPDSLSGSELHTSYQNYLNGTTNYTINSFGDVFSNRYNSLFGSTNVHVDCQAVSGDTTTNLLTLLKSGDINVELNNADAIVLCIGANNVLGPSLANIGNYLGGTKTIEQMQALIDEGVNTFYAEINEIMDTLIKHNSNIKIYPMTIYYPYKYANLNELKVFVDGTEYTSYMSSYLSTLNTKFQALNTSAMTGLKNINDYFLTNYYNDFCYEKNVTPVDIQSEFDKISKTNYPDYLNVDTLTMRLDLTNNEAMQIMNGNYSALAGLLLSNPCLDSHPTLQGHAKIGQIYKDTICDLFISGNKTLSGKTSVLSNFDLSYEYIGNSGLNFYVEKIIDDTKSQVQKLNNSITSLSSSNFVGTGKIIVIGYNNDNEAVCASNVVDFNIANDSITESATISYLGQTSGSTATYSQIAVNYSFTSNFTPTVKVYKKVSSTETELSVTYSNGKFTIDTTDIVGTNVDIYLKTYNSTTLLATSNKITTNFSEPVVEESINISSNVSLMNINTNSVSSFNLTYNYSGRNATAFTLIMTGSISLSKNLSSTTTAINLLDLFEAPYSTSGTISGTIKVIAKNRSGTTICSSNEISYNITKNAPVVVEDSASLQTSSMQVTSGDISTVTSITLNYSFVTTRSNIILKLYKIVDGVESCLKSNLQYNSSKAGSVIINTSLLVGNNVQLSVKAFEGSSEQSFATSSPLTLNFVNNESSETSDTSSKLQISNTVIYIALCSFGGIFAFCFIFIIVKAIKKS